MWEKRSAIEPTMWGELAADWLPDDKGYIYTAARAAAFRDPTWILL